MAWRPAAFTQIFRPDFQGRPKTFGRRPPPEGSGFTRGTQDPSIWLAPLGIGIAVAVALVCAFAAVSAREDAWHDAEQSSATLMLAMNRDLARSLAIIDLSLHGAQAALAIPGIAEASPALRKAALFDGSAANDDVGEMLAIGPDGTVFEALRGPVEAMPNLAAEEFFRAQRERNIGLFVSGIVRGGICRNEPCMIMSRRLSSQNQEFGGVVVATLKASYLRRLFSSMAIGPGGTIILSGLDGKMVWWQRGADGHIGGADREGDSRRSIVSQPSGEFAERSNIDGVGRLHMSIRVDGLPLVLSVNMAPADIYAHWRWRALIIAPAFLLMSASIATLTLLFRGEMRRRTKAEATLAHLADSDSLTGLGNRRALVRETSRLLDEAVASGGPLSIIMVDVDYFKRFNDLFGHLDGDDVLTRVAETLRRSTAASAFLARFGGEEFIIVGHYDVAAAETLSEQIRRSIEALAIPHPGSPYEHVTVSLGLASGQPSPKDGAQGLMKQADEALYLAKQAGRNIVRMRLAAEARAE